MEPQPKQIKEESIRAYKSTSRSITVTTFILLLVLVGAISLQWVRPPFMYVLFSLLFIVDFTGYAMLIFKWKMFLWGSREIRGIVAYLIGFGYGAMALIFLLFAIYSVTVYYR